MEKRERRNRSRRPRDPPSRSDPPPAVNTANNKDEKKTVEEKTEKKVIDHTAIPDPHMFDNLKRETEDIAALKRPTVGGKRQIFSNWAKYETPMHDDADSERSGKIGEDFEALLEQGGQKGGHFRFKSERCWDPESASVRSAVLTLDLAALAEALSSVPLYQRLDLPTDVFMAEEIERMDRQARESAAALRVNRTKRTLQAKAEAEKVSASILKKLMGQEDLEEVRVDLRADGDVQPLPLQFDMNDLNDPTATAEWDTPSVEDEREPSRQTQVVMPELQPRESPARFEEGASRRSPSVGVPEEPAPAPVLTPAPAPVHAPVPTTISDAKQHSPTPELQSPVEPEAPALARGGQGGKGEGERGGRRQGKRQKGKDRRSWASSDEGDADASATKVEPQLPPALAEPQAPQPVPQKQETPPPMAPPPVAPPPAPQQTKGGRRNKGERVPPNPPHPSKEGPPKAPNAEAKRSSPAPAPEDDLSNRPSKPPNATAVPSSQPPPSQNAPAPSTRRAAGDDDQLDFLLSLRHPVREEPVAFNTPSSTAVRATIDEDEPVRASAPKPLEAKTEALEDWLDSMLDD